jgi:hypothetical protein
MAAGDVISEAITKLNKALKGTDEIGGGYGDIGTDGKIQLAKKTIIDLLE